MGAKAKLFKSGRSQAVRIPAEFRFNDTDEVYVRRDPSNGDIVLSIRPDSWDDFLALLDSPGCDPDASVFLKDRTDLPPAKRELF